MYGLRETAPQHPHVVRTMWPPTLTLQFRPGTSGARHSPQ